MNSQDLAKHLESCGVPVVFPADFVIGLNSYPGVVVHERDLRKAMWHVQDTCLTPRYQYINIKGNDVHVSVHCLNFCCSLPTEV